MKRIYLLFYLFLLPLIWLEGTGSGSTQAPSSSPPGKAPTFKDYLGVDDGFGLSILYTGHVNGNLEPCG